MTTKPQATTEETLEPCPFCGSKPETGITGAPECDNWRYVKCSNNYCSIRYSLFTVKSWNTRISPASTAPVVNAMWEALKAECCKNPAEAKTVVFCGEDKFKKAMALYAAAATTAPVEQSDSLLAKITQIADIGSAEEFGDAIERLRAIRKLIATADEGAR